MVSKLRIIWKQTVRTVALAGEPVHPAKTAPAAPVPSAPTGRPFDGHRMLPPRQLHAVLPLSLRGGCANATHHRGYGLFPDNP